MVLKEQIKILLLLNKLNPGSGPFYRKIHFDQEKYQITVASLFGSQNDIVSAAKNWFGISDKDKITLVGIGAKRGIDIRASLRLLFLLRNGNFDVIQTCQDPSGIIGLILSKFARRPVAVHFEGAVWHKYSALNRLLKSCIFLFADGLIFVSRSVLESLNRFEAHLAKNIHKKVIYNGVDISELQNRNRVNIRSKLRIAQDEFVIGYTGRFVPFKRIDTLIRSVSLLKNNKIRLLLVGDGSERERLKRFGESIGISDRCIYTGMVNRKKVYTLFQAMDIFVIPSSFEGLSSSLVQAMGARLPVIVSDIKENREIVKEGGTGMLFRFGDPGDLAKKIDLLINNVALRKSLGKSAHDFIRENIDIRTIVEQYCELYLYLLGKKWQRRESKNEAYRH